MSGYVGDLNEKQARILEKFRDSVADILGPDHDDHYLLRWLRARNFDPKKSESMLRNHMTWRKQISADTLLTEWIEPEVIQKYFTGGLFGYDKQGCPIFIDPFGNIDLKGLLRSAKKSDAILSKACLLEKIHNVVFKEQTKKVCSLNIMERKSFQNLLQSEAMLGRRVDQCVVIYDLEKFSMKHLWKPGVDCFCEMITMVEDHYPETLKTTFVINAPRIFPIAFHLVKPFLSEETVKKIHILGTNYKDELYKYIDKDQLPVHWGGTCVDPDGDTRCRSKICQGGEIPKEYYKLFDLDTENFTSVCIRRGSSLQIDFSVTVINSVIRWQFSTDGYDIGFGIYKRTKDVRQKAGIMEEILPSQRVNSHLILEDGSICCKQIGTYVVRFDNTYSWARGKSIKYLIEVLEPEEGLSTSISQSTSSLI